MIRACSPSQNISFGKLKFELDKPTKEYLLKLSANDEMSASDTLETVESTVLMMHNLSSEANKIAQANIDNSVLKGKTLEEVWPDLTVVKVGVKPKRISEGKILLNAYFNDDFYHEEDSENLYNPHGPNRSNINAYALWSFLSAIGSDFSDSLKYFVDKSMKKNSKFKEMEIAELQNKKIVVDVDEEIAKRKLKKWLDM